MPLVSVIIPTFNRYAVGRAISSVFQQNIGLDQMELIVVDDHSSEAFCAFLRLFEADQTLQKNFIFRDENRGPGFCRNLAITQAQGKYILFLDSDDFLPSYAIKDMVAVAQRTQCDIVSGKRLHLDGLAPNGNVFLKTLLKSSVYDSPTFNNLSVNGKIFRTTFLQRKNIKFAETRKYGEDQPFMAKSYLTARSISILGDKPYLHMERFDDLSLVVNQTSIDNRLNSAKEVFDIIEEYADPQKDTIMLKLRPFDEIALSINQILKDDAETHVEVRHLEALIDLINKHYTPELYHRLGAKQKAIVDQFINLINNRFAA